MNIEINSHYYINTIPLHMCNKLNNEEQEYVNSVTHIAKWIYILNSDPDFDYLRWANDDDMKIMTKLLS